MSNEPKGKTMWVPTFKLNLMRAVAAGIIWIPIMFFKNPTPAPGGVGFLFIGPFLAFPLLWLIFFLPLSLIAKGLAGFLDALNVPFGSAVVGFGVLIGAIFFVVGDPILAIIHRSKPGFLPVKDYGFVNFKITMFVVDEE